MDQSAIQDRVNRAMGAAARVFGAEHELHRPDGPGNPVTPGTRVMRLHAAFDGGDPGYRRPAGWERAVRGTFDGVYVRAGHYLVGAEGVLFVAATPALKRPACVRCNARVDAWRTPGPDAPGLNGYGGAGPDVAVLRRWPALVTPGGVLLPVSAPALRPGDRVTAPGVRMTVGAVEQSEWGWRIAAKG